MLWNYLKNLTLIMWVITTAFSYSVAYGQSVISDELNFNNEELLRELDSLRARVDSLDQSQAAAHAKSRRSSKPKWPTAALEGLIQTDLGYFTQDAASHAAIGDLQDGSDFRRARIGVHGKAWYSTSYMIEMEFAALDRVHFTDVYMQLDRKPANVRIGRWRQPFGMSALTSVKELSFIERASTFAFVPFRQTGIGASGSLPSDNGTWAFSAFRTESDGIGGSLGDDGGWGLASRTTYLLFDDPHHDRLLHIGFDYSLVAPPDDSVRFSSRPEAFLAEVGVSKIPNFVDTGNIATEAVNLFALEGAFQIGRLHGQSEVFYASMNQIANSDVNFRGAYGQLVYSMSGEPRPYNRKQGVFSRPNLSRSVDCGGVGAWELAARWSWIDLNDSTILGGELTTLTAGINWYLNPRFKFQFNYINASHEGLVGDATSHLYVARAQVDF